MKLKLGTSVPYEYTLPWPPSLNNCRAVVRGRLITTKRGRDYHVAVEYAVLSQGFDGVTTGPVTLWIDAYYPDKRRRDLDNLGKLAIDGLVKAGVLGDDSQIVELRLRRAGFCDSHSERKGFLHVRIFEEPKP